MQSMTAKARCMSSKTHLPIANALMHTAHCLGTNKEHNSFILEAGAGEETMDLSVLIS